MTKRIKNSDTIDHIWVGQTVEPNEYYTIQTSEESSWASNSTLLIDIANGIAVVNDGYSDYGNVSDAIDFLKGNVIKSQIISQPSVTISSAPPFGSKTVVVNGVTKKLYARNVGFQSAVIQGSNDIIYTATHPWSKILGVEVVNCEALDKVDFRVLDTTSGSYSGYPNFVLNQFAFTHNLPKDYYLRMSNFDADLYVGMQIKVTYVSVSAKTIGINLIFNEVKD